MAREEAYHCDVCGYRVHGREGITLSSPLKFIDGGEFLPEKSKENKIVKEVCFHCFSKNFFTHRDDEESEEEGSSKTKKRQKIGFRPKELAHKSLDDGKCESFSPARIIVPQTPEK